jgi:hypothetical protein
MSKIFSKNIFVHIIFIVGIFSLYFNILPYIGKALPHLGMRYPALFQSQRGAEKILKVENPFKFEEIYYPEGAFAFEGLLPSFIFSVLGVFFNPFLSQNLSIMMSFFLSALGMFLLTFYLTKDRIASTISGFYYSFSPLHIRYLAAYPPFHMEWFPFFTLYLLKGVNEEKPVKHSLIAGIFLAFCAFSSWYYFVFCLLILPLFFVFNLNRLKRTVLVCFITGIVSIMICGPVLYYMLINLKMVKAGATAEFMSRSGANILSFILPSPTSWFFSKIVPNIYGKTKIPPIYISYIAISLSFIGLFYCRNKNTIFFSLLGLLFFIISLGPVLNIGGLKVGIKLPYHFLLSNFPFPFQFTREIRRYAVIVIMSAGILSGYGILALRKYLSGYRKIITMAISLFFLFLEIFPKPFSPHFPVAVPNFYFSLDKEQGKFSIVELPLYRMNGYVILYYSMFHHKNIMGGAGDRPHYIFTKTISAFPFLHQLRFLSEKGGERNFYYTDILKYKCSSLSISISHYFNIKYILLHKHDLRLLSENIFVPEGFKTYKITKIDPIEEYKNFLLSCGWFINYEDEFIYVFSPPQEKPMPFVVIGNGWSDVQTYDKTKPIRWMKGEAELRIVSEEDKEITLSFMMKSSRRSPLKLYLNNKELKEIVVEPFPESFSINLSVSKGVNILSLKGDKELPYGIAEVFLSEGCKEKKF